MVKKVKMAIMMVQSSACFLCAFYTFPDILNPKTGMDINIHLTK